MVEFRLYNKLGCGYFDLIEGELEPKQTKGLGLLLAKSPTVLRGFLGLVWKEKKRVETLLSEAPKVVVHCEPRMEKVGRADILILFYDEHYSSRQAFVVEAKSIKRRGAKVNEKQSKGYEPFVREFGKNVDYVALTKTEAPVSEGVKSLTWERILRLLSDILQAKGRSMVANQERGLIEDYFNFLIHIKGGMKLYEEEVMSIPASETIDIVTNPNCLLYEQLAEEPKKENVYKTALYLAFRGKRGVMTHLYKVDAIIRVRLRHDIAFIKALDKEHEGKWDLESRLQFYTDHVHPKGDEPKYLYILNREEIITLPKKVKPEVNVQNSRPYYKLSEFFEKDPERNDAEYIVLKKKR
ncbi:MAG: hypothetical protein LBN29_13915 [Mediterranea sp.]|jgi:hypothetical protein|nr:hypothetical protein [Mediterranea sp.]